MSNPVRTTVRGESRAQSKVLRRSLTPDIGRPGTVTFLAAFAAAAFVAMPVLADTYKITVRWVSGSECIIAKPSTFTITPRGEDVDLRGEAGSTFSAKAAPDGTFKASFTGRDGSNYAVEGNVTPGRRVLKVHNLKFGCHFEGKE